MLEGQRQIDPLDVLGSQSSFRFSEKSCLKISGGEAVEEDNNIVCVHIHLYSYVHPHIHKPHTHTHKEATQFKSTCPGNGTSPKGMSSLTSINTQMSGSGGRQRSMSSRLAWSTEQVLAKAIQ